MPWHVTLSYQHSVAFKPRPRGVPSDYNNLRSIDRFPQKTDPICLYWFLDGNGARHPGGMAFNSGAGSANLSMPRRRCAESQYGQYVDGELKLYSVENGLSKRKQL